MRKSLTKNFSIAEFGCKDGTPYPEKWVDSILLPLAKDLQKIREAAGVPLHITSAYRTSSHNKKIGGAKNSYHVKGMAVDIVARGLSASKLHNIILSLIKEGKIQDGGLGIYANWVHYDHRGFKARWRG